MGQSSSRQRPTADNTTRIDRTRISPPTIQRDVEGRPIRSDNLIRRRPLSEASTTPTPKRSRREYVTRSLLGLRSSSSSSSGSRRNSTPAPSEAAQAFKRRYPRPSRRWSKTPEVVRDHPEPPNEDVEMANGDGEHVCDDNEGAGLGAGSSSAGTHTNSSRPSTPFPVSRPPTPRMDNSAERSPDALSEEERRLSQNIGTWLGGSPSGSPSLHSSQQDTTHITSHQHEEAEAVNAGRIIPLDQDPREPEARRIESVATEAAPSPVPEPQPSPTRSARSFGAPGTLVVVQGVVNAQDPARAPASTSAPPQSTRTSSRLTPPSRPSTHRRSSSTPRLGGRSSVSAEDRSNIRNRLSSFIRPSSMLSRSQQDEAHATLTSGPAALDDPLSDANSTMNVPAATDSSSTIDDRATASPENRTSNRGLSSASIDVLGTLLSVAATATAASLFTPMMNSDSTSTPSSSPLSRPLSPTPTSGLGSLGALGLNNPAQNASVGASQDSRERIRNVWESIRERVGLNSRNNAGIGPGISETTGSSPEANRTLRSGEAMLADMARALNAGLGLAESSSDSHTDAAQTNSIMRGIPSSATSPDRSHPPPAEGSFERFLTNLQADLRTLLSEDALSIGSSSNDDGNSFDPSSSSSSSPTPGASSEREGADMPTAASHARLPTDGTADSGITDDGGNDADDEDRPSLATVADSVEYGSDVDASPDDHEDDAAGRAERMEPDGGQSSSHPRVPTPIPSMWTNGPSYNEARERMSRPPGGGHPESLAGTQTPASRPGTSNGGERERTRPAINLWRLYRFAPIPASQALETASAVRPPRSQARTSADASMSTGASAATSTEPLADLLSTTSEAEVRSSEGDNADATADQASAPSSGTGDDPTANIPAFVVPVIVVGLQSVDAPTTEDEDDNGPSSQPQQEPSETESARSSMPESTPWPMSPTSGATPATGTGSRSWGSRAANALRGLRPARRASRSRRSADGTGSRTFLIYVIGGYYPPWHDMVTGSDRLDSYEALWELAEILGQVKPPTATKEDIDNSGLQIIRATDLRKYEAEGKVASNCIDRCLVCLDDYELEDELRIMSCRHTFHKTCVDKWLQVGRNNCPACRTEGVSSSATPEPAQAPPTSDSAAPMADAAH